MRELAQQCGSAASGSGAVAPAGEVRRCQPGMTRPGDTISRCSARDRRAVRGGGPLCQPFHELVCRAVGSGARPPDRRDCLAAQPMADAALHGARRRQHVVWPAHPHYCTLRPPARAVRILIPVACATLLIVPAMVYLGDVYSGEWTGSFLAFYPTFFRDVYPKGEFSFLHFWFLVYSMLYTFLACRPLAACCARPAARALPAGWPIAACARAGCHPLALPCLPFNWLYGASRATRPAGVGQRLAPVSCSFSASFLSMVICRYGPPFRAGIGRTVAAGRTVGCVVVAGSVLHRASGGLNPFRDLPPDYSWSYMAFNTVFVAFLHPAMADLPARRRAPLPQRPLCLSSPTAARPRPRHLPAAPSDLARGRPLGGRMAGLPGRALRRAVRLRAARHPGPGRYYLALQPGRAVLGLEQLQSLSPGILPAPLAWLAGCLSLRHSPRRRCG